MRFRKMDEVLKLHDRIEWGYKALEPESVSDYSSEFLLERAGVYQRRIAVIRRELERRGAGYQIEAQ